MSGLMVFTIEGVYDACACATDENESLSIHGNVMSILYSNFGQSFGQGYYTMLVKHLRLAILEYEQFTSAPAVGIITGCTN